MFVCSEHPTEYVISTKQCHRCKHHCQLVEMFRTYYVNLDCYFNEWNSSLHR